MEGVGDGFGICMNCTHSLKKTNKTKLKSKTLNSIDVPYFTGVLGGVKGKVAIFFSRTDLSRRHHSNTTHDKKSVVGWGVGGKDIWCKISNTFTPSQEQTLTTGQSDLPIVASHPSILVHSLQGEWNSEAGRGVQCVVSKFRMYFCALKRERKRQDGGGMENERCGRQWIKSAELDYISLVLSVAHCHTNLSHLLRAFTWGGASKA